MLAQLIIGSIDNMQCLMPCTLFNTEPFSAKYEMIKVFRLHVIDTLSGTLSISVIGCMLSISPIKPHLSFWTLPLSFTHHWFDYTLSITPISQISRTCPSFSYLQCTPPIVIDPSVCHSRRYTHRTYKIHIDEHARTCICMHAQARTH